MAMSKMSDHAIELAEPRVYVVRTQVGPLRGLRAPYYWQDVPACDVDRAEDMAVFFSSSDARAYCVWKNHGAQS
jgi:hypothetical protein